MSIQNVLLRAYLTLRIKQRLTPDRTVQSARTELDEAIATYMPPPPRGITIEDFSGLDGAEVVVPDKRANNRCILYFHGGGFVMGSPRSHRGVTCALARHARCRVVVPRYRLAPEHPYPAALDDAERACRAVIASGVEPASLALAGDQAGAWLVFSLLLRRRERRQPLPGAVVALSPLVDLTQCSPSIVGNAPHDPVLTPQGLRRCIDTFAPKGVAAIPSLLHADLRGLPPTLIQTSTIELLRDDARRMAAALRDAGVDTTLDEWRNVPPMWHIFAAGLPEGRDAVIEAARFIDKTLLARMSASTH